MVPTLRLGENWSLGYCHCPLLQADAAGPRGPRRPLALVPAQAICPGFPEGSLSSSWRAAREPAALPGLPLLGTGSFSSRAQTPSRTSANPRLSESGICSSIFPLTARISFRLPFPPQRDHFFPSSCIKLPTPPEFPEGTLLSGSQGWCL